MISSDAPTEEVELSEEHKYKMFSHDITIPVPEQYIRIAALWGHLAVRTIAGANVLLVGIGAVGSACLESLIRSGVQTITVMDSDVFEKSNLNRQLLALHSTIGRPKVDVARERAREINPYVNITCIQKRLGAGLKEAKELLAEIKPTIVVDAIDDTPAKVALMIACVTGERPIFDCTSMGAARREDLGEIKITNIMKTTGCPLAKTLRSQLRRSGVHEELLEKWTKAIYCPSHSVKMKGMEFLPSCITSTMSFGAALAHAALSVLRNCPEDI